MVKSSELLARLRGEEAKCPVEEKPINPQRLSRGEAVWITSGRGWAEAFVLKVNRATVTVQLSEQVKRRVQKRRWDAVKVRNRKLAGEDKPKGAGE